MTSSLSSIGSPSPTPPARPGPVSSSRSETVDFTDPAERRARLVSDHGDPGRRGQIRVIYLRPHPDAVRWARRHRDRSWLERKRDDIRSTWLFYRGPIPNTMGGGTPTPPRPHFAEEDSEWMQAEPTIEVLGERVEVEWDDAVAQCVPSLDRATRSVRAGRAGGAARLLDVLVGPVRGPGAARAG